MSEKYPTRSERFEVARERIELSRHEAEELRSELQEQYVCIAPSKQNRAKAIKYYEAINELDNFIHHCLHAQDIKIEFPGVE